MYLRQGTRRTTEGVYFRFMFAYDVRHEERREIGVLLIVVASSQGFGSGANPSKAPED
jgi:hypothetical protein